MSEEHDDDDVVKTENRLSKLPEAILHHILSLLPTKDAARTSVLSKQWEYLWTYSPNLFFGKDTSIGTSTTFLDFVDRVFFLRNFDIKNFTLRTDEISDQSRIRKWIYGLVWRNVQELRVELDNCNNALELPDCLFTCASLRLLDLKLCTRYTLKLPTSTYFSNLEVLLLDSVTFPDEDSTQMLFTACQALKGLSLVKCNWENINSVNICCPQLHWCHILDMHGYLWDESYGCRISILASSLVFFSYAGELLNDYCLYDSSLLDELELHVYYANRRSDIIAHRLYKILNGGYDVQKLVLSQCCLDVLPFAQEGLVYIPLFKNLLNLEFSLEAVDLHHHSLVKILENCPCLKGLGFRQGIKVSSDSEQLLGLFNPAPSCFLSHLKTIYVGNFDGNKQLCMDVVEVLLKRATSLQNLVFHYNPSSITSEEATGSFIEKIHDLPRAAEVLEMVYKGICVKCGRLCHVHGQKKELAG